MLGLVYSSASEVLIWLGEGGEGTEESIAILEKLIEDCRYKTHDFKNMDDYMW
jgi:hypothetical protein